MRICGEATIYCYHAGMLSEIFSFDRLWKSIHGTSLPARSIASFVQFMEQRLGGQFAYESSTIPYQRPDLVATFKIADTLQRAGIIESYTPVFGFDDEPRARLWRTKILDKNREASGGMSAQNDNGALLSALAEGLERYLWLEETDYFRSVRTATVASMSRKKTIIGPERFVGFSEELRMRDPQLKLAPENEYLWIRGYSLTQRRKVFLPAQVVSGAYGRTLFAADRKEPMIRTPITTGLATWPTKDGAILRGALEVIERDAYMIMWLNQLTMPRIDLGPWRKKHAQLDKLIANCERYRLRVHAMRLITDAPADVACAVVEDLTGHAPLYTVGLKAHSDIGIAIEGALLEALRARRNARNYGGEEIKRVREKKPSEIKHMERLAYWMDIERAHMLSFMTRGTVEDVFPSIWTDDTPTEHLMRIRAWCIERDNEFVSVDLGISKKNPLPWHVEMVVMPDLQPMHQNEQYQYLGGERLKSIPEKFGYKARKEPFADEPHPFA